MNWAWASSLDQIWRSPGFPMWLTLAAAGFFGIIVLITLLRAEKSVANGALAVITLAGDRRRRRGTLRWLRSDQRRPRGTGRCAKSPAVRRCRRLSCIDDLAGEAVLAACEKALFGSAETVAAAVSYAASQITRLAAVGDVATANKAMTPELGVAPRGRARPLRADGLCAGRATIARPANARLSGR